MRKVSAPIQLHLQQFARDDGPLDLVCAFINLRDFGITIKSLHLKTTDITGAPEYLHSIGGVLDSHICGEAFGN